MLAEVRELQEDLLLKLAAVKPEVRQAEAERRLGEIFDTQVQLDRLNQMSSIRESVFDQAEARLQAGIDAVASAGDGSTADDLRERLAGLRLGRQDFVDLENRRREAFEGDLQNAFVDNTLDGVGPVDRDDIASMATQQGVDLTATTQLSAEDIINVAGTAARYAAGAEGRTEDKSLGRLYLEELPQEFLHTLRPDVYLRKQGYLALGLGKGLKNAAVGLGEVVLGAGDLVAESTAMALGFEDGGIFGTDATDTVAAVLTLVGENGDFDGVTKGAIALGGILDGELERIQKSGNIDGESAEFVSKLGGELIFELALAGAGLPSKGAQAADKLGDAVRAGEMLEDAATLAARGAENLDDGRMAGRLDNGPSTSGAPLETPGKGVTSLNDRPGSFNPIDDGRMTRPPQPVIDTHRGNMARNSGGLPEGPLPDIAVRDAGLKIRHLGEAGSDVNRLGRTQRGLGPERQLFPENCPLASLECSLVERGVVASHRNQGALRNLAKADYGLESGKGMNMGGIRRYLDAHGLPHAMPQSLSYNEMRRLLASGSEVHIGVRSGPKVGHLVKVEDFVFNPRDGHWWVSIGDSGLPQRTARHLRLDAFDAIRMPGKNVVLDFTDPALIEKAKTAALVVEVEAEVVNTLGRAGRAAP